MKNYFKILLDLFISPIDTFDHCAGETVEKSNLHKSNLHKLRQYTIDNGLHEKYHNSITRLSETDIKNYRASFHYLNKYGLRHDLLIHENTIKFADELDRMNLDNDYKKALDLLENFNDYIFNELRQQHEIILFRFRIASQLKQHNERLLKL